MYSSEAKTRKTISNNGHDISHASTPGNSTEFSNKILNNPSQLSYNVPVSNLEVSMSNISTPVHSHTKSMKTLPRPEMTLNW